MAKNKFSLLVLCLSCTNLIKAQSPASFTLINYNNNYTITCTQPAVLMSTTPYNPLAVWSGPGFTVTGYELNIMSQGVYSVTSLNSTQTFTVHKDISFPISSISPSISSITCSNLSTTFTVSALTATTSIIHSWYSPYSPLPGGTPSHTSSNVTDIANISQPGTHTVLTCYSNNGCCTSKSFSVTTIDTVPTFSLTSSNFLLGCSSMSLVSLCATNTSSVSNTFLKYAFFPPGITPTVPISNNAFSNQSCTMTTNPGKWHIVAMDTLTQCQLSLPFTLIQNTVVTAPLITTPSPTLNCYTPSLTLNCMVLNGLTYWVLPDIPPIYLPGTSVNITAGMIPYPAPTCSAITTNTTNMCKAVATTTVFQSFNVNSLPATYTNNCVGSTTIAPGFIGSAQNYTFTWSTTPNAGAFLSSTNSMSVVVNGPGNYLCTSTNLANGCSKTDTVKVLMCVGVKEYFKENFKIFPNPSSGSLTIENPNLQASTFEIYSSTGLMLFKETFNENSHKLVLHLPAGLYFYKLIVADQTMQTRKLLIE